MQKIKLFLVLTLLCVGVSESWAETSTVTASRITGSSATWTGSQNESWAVTVNGGATNQTVTNGYAQVGTRQQPSTSMTFSTSGISGEITSIVVDCAAYNGYATISATVGGASFGTQEQSVPSWSNNSGGNVTFSGSASGDITITMTNGYVDWFGDRTGGRAMYIKSITITYKKRLTWSEGSFTYSNYHIQSTSNQGFMDETFDYYPGVPEIAISLNLDDTKSVTDVVYFAKYYLNGYYYDIDGTSFVNGSSTLTIKNKAGYTITNPTGTTTTTDDDGVGQATYVYDETMSDNGWYAAGQTTTGTTYYARRYYYKRTHDVDYSDVTSINIPKEVTHDGVTYKVTAIQKWGFSYFESDQNIRTSCDTYELVDGKMVWSDKATASNDYANINDHSNNYLETVEFEQLSNIHSIGDYAFMSCKKLTSIVIPASVTYFGQGIFECDRALVDCRFQTLTSAMKTYYNNLETSASTTDGTTIPITDDMIGQVRWHTLRNFTFWWCTALESLELPDGITEIEGLPKGASLQYMSSLINIRLPNTLTKIGSHFLCGSQSLKTLTIPASVQTIDGACFHGCESLESVYLLGPASALAANVNSTEKTFGENSIFCAGHVANCKFYVTEEHLQTYKNQNSWKMIDEGGSTHYGETKTADAAGVTFNYGNELTTIPVEKRAFPAKWVTAIFPYQVDNYQSIFGDAENNKPARVAVMDPAAKHTVTIGKEQKTGKQVRMYNIVFKLIPENQSYIPAGTPVMICPGKAVEYQLYNSQQQASDWFRIESTKEHGTSVTAEDGAVITMKGKYVPYTMLPWDFYFMYKNKTVDDESGAVTYDDPDEVARFYRVPDAENAATVGICRCYWTINMDGVKIDATMAPSNGCRFFVDDEVDGIDGVETRINIAGIYDLQGRKLDIDQNDLPQGLYIVNGKKVVKK